MEHSSTVQRLLIALSAIGSLISAWFVRRRSHLYSISVALFAPAMGYWMSKFGSVEMGGIIHSRCAGVYALPFHFMFQRFRKARRSRSSP